jgi:hypothetical protein
MGSAAREMTHQPITLGNELYLWTNNSGTGGRTADALLISCHGGYIPRWKWTEWREGKDGWLKVPTWTTLVFYARHGESLDNPGILRIIQGHETPIDAAHPGDSLRNYRLSKFQTRNGESYDTLVAGLHWTRPGRRVYPSRDPFDFLTIRNRWWNKFGTTLRFVLSRLEAENFYYPEIHCSFCRSSVVDFSS